MTAHVRQRLGTNSVHRIPTFLCFLTIGTCLDEETILPDRLGLRIRRFQGCSKSTLTSQKFDGISQRQA
jgi:hypothetical protein